jgi:hypothetical protein
MTARPSTTPDDRLRDLHAEGATVAYIAGATGLSPRRVRERLHLLGLAPNRAPRGERVPLLLRVTHEQREAIRARAKAAGMTMTAWVLAAALPPAGPSCPTCGGTGRAPEPATHEAAEGRRGREG